jgi:hypothetical protein
MLNVLHYQDNASGAVDWAAVNAALRGHIIDHLQTLCGGEVTWNGITYREDIPGSIGITLDFAAGVVTGTNATGDQMRQAAMLVRKRTNTTTRPNQGWAFQGGVTVAALSAASRWEVAFTTAVQDFWEDIRLINTGVGDVLSMVIKARNPTAPNTVAYNSVASVTAVNVPRTVRSRREGIGT